MIPKKLVLDMAGEGNLFSGQDHAQMTGLWSCSVAFTGAKFPATKGNHAGFDPPRIIHVDSTRPGAGTGRFRVERRYRRAKAPGAVPLASAPARGRTARLRPVPAKPGQGHQPSVARPGGDCRRLRRGHGEG